MMGRARASGEAQVMGVAVAFFKNLMCVVNFAVFIETKKTRTVNTNNTAKLSRRDLFSKTQW